MIEVAEEIRQLDFESLKIINSLAHCYDRWLKWNKYYKFTFKIIDIKEQFETSDIIIIHNMWIESSNTYTIANGEEFIEDVAYMLNDYIECRDFDEDELEYLNNFWVPEVEYLTTL